MIAIREAIYPADYAIMAAVLTAEHGDWPVSAAELAAADSARDPRFYHLALLAELDGEVVGVGTVGHIPYIHREDRFGIDLHVRPERQGQGAGKALYDTLLEGLASHHPGELITEAWEALPRPARFLSERGFRPTWRRIDSTLQVSHFDFTPYSGLEERLLAQGISMATYAGMTGDPDRARKLHRLDFALLQDMPYGEPQTMLPLEQFIGETLNAPAFLPEACFIARSGEEWIGYSNLLIKERFFETQMTGVLPLWRGKGVATLLKLKGIQYALAHGALELRTTNDAVNAAMLAINRRLGFQEVGAMIRWNKTFYQIRNKVI